MSFYQNKVNGSVLPKAAVTSKFDYISITTTVDIRTVVDGSATSQANLDKLIEIISTVAQPVIISSPYPVTTTFVLKLAIEHTGAWTAATLQAAIVAGQYNGTGFTSGNTTVVVASSF